MIRLTNFEIKFERNLLKKLSVLCKNELHTFNQSIKEKASHDMTVLSYRLFRLTSFLFCLPVEFAACNGQPWLHETIVEQNSIGAGLIGNCQLASELINGSSIAGQENTQVRRRRMDSAMSEIEATPRKR